MQTDIAILLPTDSLWAQYGVQTEPFPVYPKGSPYDIPCLLWEAVHKNGGNCDLVTRRQLDSATVRDGKLIVGKKAYKALLLPPATDTHFLALSSYFLPHLEMLTMSEGWMQSTGSWLLCTICCALVPRKSCEMMRSCSVLMTIRSALISSL